MTQTFIGIDTCQVIPIARMGDDSGSLGQDDQGFVGRVAGPEG